MSDWQLLLFRRWGLQLRRHRVQALHLQHSIAASSTGALPFPAHGPATAPRPHPQELDLHLSLHAIHRHALHLSSLVPPAWVGEVRETCSSPVQLNKSSVCLNAACATPQDSHSSGSSSLLARSSLTTTHPRSPGGLPLNAEVEVAVRRVQPAHKRAWREYGQESSSRSE